MLLAMFASAAAATFAPNCSTLGDDVRRIETSGVSAEYRVVQNADGTRRLIGQYCDTGQRFVYVIKRSGLVKGHVGNQPVSFRARHSA